MVIAFNGSPHKQGNTAAVLNEVLRGAKASGMETKLVDLNELALKGCQACYGCQRPDSTGACVIPDELQPLFEEIYKADALVFGSPMYMGQMTSQAKRLFDRFFAFIRPDFTSRVSDKKTVLAFVHGQQNPSLYKPYIDATAGAFTSMGFPVVETIVGAGLYAPGMGAQDETLMAKAYATGQALARK